MENASKGTELTILIPAYKEEKRIGKTLDSLAAMLSSDELLKSLNVEVIVVSADSNDKTHIIVKQKVKLFKRMTLLKPGPKLGKGRDVQFGMLRAKGDVVMFMDADLATPLHHLPRVYKKAISGADIVIATRNLKKHHSNLIRRGVSNIGNILFRAIGGVWVEDSQCGFKMFSKEAAKVCFERMTITGWGFDMEILTIAKTNNYKIVSHRVSDWKNVPEGPFESEASILKTSLHSLIDLLIIGINRITGKYRK